MPKGFGWTKVRKYTTPAAANRARRARASRRLRVSIFERHRSATRAGVRTDGKIRVASARVGRIRWDGGRASACAHPIIFMASPVILIIRDGWGINPDSPENAERDADATVLAKTPFPRPSARRLSLRHAQRQRRGRGPARRADGQLRGRPPQPRRGPDRLPGFDAHLQGHRRRQTRGESRHPGGVQQGGGTGAAAAFPGVGQRRRRPQPSRPPRRPGQPGARHGGEGHHGPRVHGRTRHLAHRWHRLPGNARSRPRPERGAHRHGHRAVLRHGPRQPLGTHQTRLGRHRARQGHGLRARPHDAITPLYSDGTTDEFLPPMVFTPPPGDEPRARRRRGVLFQLPRGPRAAAFGGVFGRRISTRSSARSGRRWIS